MTRLLILLLAIFALCGCSSALENAEKSYKQGNYLQSVQTIADYLDKENKLPSDSDKMFAMIQDIMLRYEQQIGANSVSNYDTNIAAYHNLLLMRKRLDQRFYDTNIRFFTSKYSINDLNHTIAQLYYNKAISVVGTNKQNYKSRADNFSQSLNYAIYKDNEKQFSLNDKKYRELFAEDYFQAGKRYANSKQYQAAAEQFNLAVAIYDRYGDYKNSRKLATQYDQMYRKAETDRLYKQASELGKTAKTHVDYRKAADIFQQSQQIYSQYGQLNDAQQQHDHYKKQGQITVYIQSERNLQRLIKDKLRANYITFVDSPSSADVVLIITEDFTYSQEKDRINTKSVKEDIKEGSEQRPNSQGKLENRDVYKTYHFTSQETLSRNHAQLKLKLMVSGDLNYNSNYNVEKSSERIVTDYSGDMPRGYKNHTKGEWLNEQELHKLLMENIWRDLVNDFKQIARKLEQI